MPSRNPTWRNHLDVVVRPQLGAPLRLSSLPGLQLGSRFLEFVSIVEIARDALRPAT